MSVKSSYTTGSQLYKIAVTNNLRSEQHQAVSLMLGSHMFRCEQADAIIR